MSQNKINNYPEDGQNEEELAGEVFDIITTIQDPEKKPSTLGDLDVVKEELITVVQGSSSESYIVKVEFTPTVPHCSLATLIGLCIRVKLERNLQYKFKLDIQLTSGTHDTEKEVNKQINDKERVAAAMENPNLKILVEECIQELE